MNEASGADQFGFPPPTRLADDFLVADVEAVFPAVPGECSIHSSGVHVGKTQRLGDEPGVGTFAAGAGSVDGNDNGLALFQCRFLGFILPSILCL